MLHQSRNLDLEEVVMEWIQQWRSEKVSLNCSLIIAQAEKFYSGLKAVKYFSFKCIIKDRYNRWLYVYIAEPNRINKFHIPI